MDLQTKFSRREALKLGVAATTATLAFAACGGGGTGGTGGSGSHTLNMWAWAGASLQQSSFNAVAAAYPSDFKGTKLNVTIAQW